MTYIPGDNWVICDRCGFRIRASNLRTEWTGVKVCSKCYEPKHAQLDVKARPEKIAAEIIRSQPTDIYLDENIYITSANDTLRFLRNTACPDIVITHGTYTKATYLTAIKTALEADSTMGGGITYTVATVIGKVTITPNAGTIGFKIGGSGSGTAGFTQDIAEASYISAQIDL